VCVAPPEEPQIDLAVGSWVSDHNSYKMAVKVYAGPASCRFITIGCEFMPIFSYRLFLRLCLHGMCLPSGPSFWVLYCLPF
jgi:hypothetical protein